MGEGITGAPNTYPAGLDFDYSVWAAGTQIDLVNVNWDSEYVSTVMFGGTGNGHTAGYRRAQLDAHIDTLQGTGIRLTNTRYIKPNEDILLPIAYNEANRFNYVRVSNPLMPISGDRQKNYYYFIIHSEMDAPGVTRFRLQLDLWQTYVYDATFGNCYVERGHIGIANENQFDNYGRDYLTVPEGLDIGADYRTIVKRTDEVIGRDGLTSEIDILVFSTRDLLQDPGTEASPNYSIGPGSNINGMPMSATAYLFPDVQQYASWLGSMADYPWITEGVISVNAIPKVGRYLGPYSFTYQPVGPTRIVNLWLYPKKHTFFNDWRDNSGFMVHVPAEYRHLKKLFTFPYMAIELTTWSASPVLLRPEAWNDPDAFVLERPNIIPPGQRVQFTPRSYNSDGQDIEPYLGMDYDDIMDVPGMTTEIADELWTLFENAGDDSGDYLDIITQIGDFPQLPIVNNAAISYMAANAHSIAYQRQSAEWSQTRALSNANRDYGNVTTQMQTAQSLSDMANIQASGQTGIANKQMADQAAIRALTGTAGSAASGQLAFGSRGGAAGLASGLLHSIGDGLSTGTAMESAAASTALANSGRSADVAIQNRGTGQIRDTNLALARFGARGDYANEIAGINARVQDAQAIQPSIAGQFGGDMTNLAHGTMEVSIRWKLIDNAAVRVVCDYWLRFGYAIRAFIQPPQSLMVMQKFTYWKMAECYIASATIPENHKQGLKGIMEKGVTVYANPADVGVADIKNNPALSGVSY